MFTKRLALVVVFVFTLVGVAFSAVPPIISYQGKLMQTSGTPVPDGVYSVTFSIYDVPSGGSYLWRETNSHVLVKDGLFSVLMGSVLNIPANIFDSSDRWLAIQVGDNSEMAPRQKIASVAYAQVAEKANSVADGAVTTDKVALGAITADRLAPGVAIPPGTILMWSGAANQIPFGWALCDGTNGTPNLRNKFIAGAGDQYAVGASGGHDSLDLTHSHSIPPHSHSITGGAHNHGPASGACKAQVGTDQSSGCMSYDGSWVGSGGSAHTHDCSSVGLSTSSCTLGIMDIRPQYYALCFIMKKAY